MAHLLSSGINGFICSAKKVAGVLKEWFISGFAGYGWKIWERNLGKYCLEIDDLVVRNKMTVYELIISKIRSIMGALAITQAHGKIKEIDPYTEPDNYLITLEDTNNFLANDFIRMQEFSGGLRSYWVQVSEIKKKGDIDVLVISKSEFMEDENPEVGDELIQFGNYTIKDRQSAIYLHADEAGQPALDLMFGIDSKSFDGKIKLRLGASLPGEPDQYKGLYAENGMLKFTDDAGNVTSTIYPDGTAEFAAGSVLFNPDRSGHIAGGAISWQWDGNKYVCKFESNVILQWNNLSEEARQNLKGIPGDKGDSIVYKGESEYHPVGAKNGWTYYNTIDKRTYIYIDNEWVPIASDGIDGNNGSDGSSFVWKGDFITAPSNPEKNWVYRNTKDGKIYIYNGFEWVLMVKDGDKGDTGEKGESAYSVDLSKTDAVAVVDINGSIDLTNAFTVLSVYKSSNKLNYTSGGSGNGTYSVSISATGCSYTLSNETVKITNIQDSYPSVNIDISVTCEGRVTIKKSFLVTKIKDGITDWVAEWTKNSTEIGQNYVISPRIFSGKKSEQTGKVTGVALGREVATINGIAKTGLFGIKEDEVSFSLDAETGEAMFSGHVKIAGGKIILNTDGSGHLANGNISWNSNGNPFIMGSLFNPLKKIQRPLSGTTIYLDFSTGFNLDVSGLTGDLEQYLVLLPNAREYVGAQCTIWYSHACTRIPHSHPHIGIVNNTPFYYTSNNTLNVLKFEPVEHRMVRLIAVPTTSNDLTEKVEWYIETPDLITIVE